MSLLVLQPQSCIGKVYSNFVPLKHTITIYNSLLPHAEQTESELVEVRRERDRLRKQKEEEVSALNSRLQAMEKSYDAILQVMTLCSI